MTPDTLYDLATDLEALELALQESGGEITPAIEAWMQRNEARVGEFVDEIGWRWSASLRKMVATESAVKAAQRELDNLEAGLLSLKKTAGALLTQLGFRKVRGLVHELAIQSNGGQRKLKVLEPYASDPRLLPGEYVSYELKADLQALRIAAEQGRTKEIAELLPLGEHVRLR